MSIKADVFNDTGTLYGKLRQGCPEDWHDYCHHPFLQGIADGTLPLECFQHYLQQDYLFLIHFSRAYALAIYKADSLEEMRAASSGVSGILDREMSLHLSYCAEWGLTENDVINQPEARSNMAYTPLCAGTWHGGGYSRFIHRTEPLLRGLCRNWATSDKRSKHQKRRQPILELDSNLRQ